jgi:hypothetical protein
MHDPLVVAFEIRRPWPRRSPPDPKPGQPRWRFKLHHTCHKSCDHEPFDRDPFPWWKPKSWTPFWTLAGRCWYFPSLVTVWHREPKGHDSGTVCPQHVRYRGPDDQWRMRPLWAWRFHVHHWQLQLPALQELRRRLLTRCTWCGGRSTRHNRVNLSRQWDRDRQPWWRGEQGLWHLGCESADTVLHRCVCEVPLPQGHNGAWGPCSTCGKAYYDEATWVGTRRAIALVGMPVEGQRWQWPKGISVHDIAKELEADRG